jgi:hypothetical protein
MTVENRALEHKNHDDGSRGHEARGTVVKYEQACPSTRAPWFATALTVPLFVLAMTEMLVAARAIGRLRRAA